MSEERRDMLAAAARHTQDPEDALIHHSGVRICGACFDFYPCLVVKLAREIERLEKQTPCVCG